MWEKTSFHYKSRVIDHSSPSIALGVNFVIVDPTHSYHNNISQFFIVSQQRTEKEADFLIMRI